VDDAKTAVVVREQPCDSTKKLPSPSRKRTSAMLASFLGADLSTALLDPPYLDGRGKIRLAPMERASAMVSRAHGRITPALVVPWFSSAQTPRRRRTRNGPRRPAAHRVVDAPAPRDARRSRRDRRRRGIRSGRGRDGDPLRCSADILRRGSQALTSQRLCHRLWVECLTVGLSRVAAHAPISTVARSSVPARSLGPGRARVKRRHGPT
jgi:hypothetical protein